MAGRRARERMRCSAFGKGALTKNFLCRFVSAACEWPGPEGFDEGDHIHTTFSANAQQLPYIGR
jgi:hypothetical protein